MKTHRLPDASQPGRNPDALRAAATRRRALVRAAAALLLCLAGLRFAAAAPQATPSPASPAKAGERVKLFYLREGPKIATALLKIAEPKESVMNGLLVNAINEDEIILIGTKDQRKLARRIIATLDLPRPGVQMEMWGIQISSRKPEDLAEVMRRVRNEIDLTQQDVRDAYAMLQEFVRDIGDDELDGDFKTILEQHLYYESALHANRPLSLSDILLRLLAAKDPVQAAARVANKLDFWLARRRQQRAAAAPAPSTKTCKSKRARAAGGAQAMTFENFFRNRGLEYKGATLGWGPLVTPSGGRDYAGENAKIGKGVLLEFALHYGRLVHDPENFDPYYLQQSAGALNSRLQAATDALNQDMQDLFVAPTLDRIRLIVAEFCDVEYAQVGKTSVASLSGVQTIVTSSSVNTFSETPPLNLTDFLTSTKAIQDKAAPLVPNPADNMVGALPLAQVIGIIGALGADRTVWRELKSGVSLNITPNVLRNMTSAELQVVLTTGDPVASGTQQQGVRPLTRVSQHDVNTRVYVNVLDFFDLSAFGSQATLTGGRGYVPVIGPIWRGLFGEAPVIGNFLSWQRDPQTVYSQSLVLTTSFITPTAMGVALLVPTDIRKEDLMCLRSFEVLEREIKDYEAGLFDPKARRPLAPCPKPPPGQ